MQRTGEVVKKQKKLKNKCCQPLCCSACRLSVSSSKVTESSNSSDRVQTICSISHAMVQYRLDEMIRERREARSEERRRRRGDMRFVVMVAMEKTSCDPREDFRESMEEMIVANRIQETKDLRRLLNYYVSMNCEENRGIIFEVFHQVCTDLFVY